MTLIAEAEAVLRQLNPEALKICLAQTEFALSVQNAVLTATQNEKEESNDDSTN